MKNFAAFAFISLCCFSSTTFSMGFFKFFDCFGCIKESQETNLGSYSLVSTTPVKTQQEKKPDITTGQNNIQEEKPYSVTCSDTHNGKPFQMAVIQANKYQSGMAACVYGDEYYNLSGSYSPGPFNWILQSWYYFYCGGAGSSPSMCVLIPQ